MSSIEEWSAVEEGNTHLDQYDLERQINPSSELNRYTKKIMAAVRAKMDAVDSDVSGRALDSAVLHLSGDEMVSGTKTFASPIAGDVLTAAAGTSLARALSIRLSEVINVKDYGAVGDGATDDWASIERAFAAAGGRGRVVFFPCGTYKISRMLNFPSRCAVVGETKGGVVILRGYDYWQDSGGSNHTAMAQVKPETGSSVIRDVLIHNIAFDARGAQYPDIMLDILVCADKVARGLEISHCRFIDCVGAHAIDLQRASFVHIHHCDFFGWQYIEESPAMYREAIQFDIYENTDDANRDNHVVIEHCRFGPSDNLGGYYTSIGNHGYSDNDAQVNFNHVVIRNNYFTCEDMPNNLACAQIQVYIFDNLLIEGNHFERCNGIKIMQRVSISNSSYNGNKNIAICNNHMDGATGSTVFPSAVYIYQTGRDESTTTTEANRELAATSNVLIFGNTIENYTAFLRVATGNGLKFLRFIGNHIKGTAGSSFYNMNVGFEIKDNTFENCGTIFTSGAFSGATTPKDFFAGYNISGNFFLDPPADSRCIHITNGAKGVIVKDNIIIDRRTNRTSSAYVLFNNGVLGGILADNIIFASTELTSYISASTSSNTTCVESGNQVYLNNEPVAEEE